MDLSTHKFDDVHISAGRYFPNAHPKQYTLASH